jgi:predicted small secreted protein
LVGWRQSNHLFWGKSSFIQGDSNMKKLISLIAMIILALTAFTGCASTVYRGTSEDRVTRILSGETPKLGQRIIVQYSKFYEETDGPGKKVVIWQAYEDRKIRVFSTDGYAFGIEDDDNGAEGTIVSDPGVGAGFVEIRNK